MPIAMTTLPKFSALKLQTLDRPIFDYRQAHLSGSAEKAYDQRWTAMELSLDGMDRCLKKIETDPDTSLTLELSDAQAYWTQIQSHQPPERQPGLLPNDVYINLRYTRNKLSKSKGKEPLTLSKEYLVHYSDLKAHLNKVQSLFSSGPSYKELEKAFAPKLPSVFRQLEATLSRLPIPFLNGYVKRSMEPYYEFYLNRGSSLGGSQA